VLIKTVSDSKDKTTIKCKLSYQIIARAFIPTFYYCCLRLRRQSGKEIVTCDRERKRRKV